MIILWIVGTIGLLYIVVTLILNWSHPLTDRHRRSSVGDIEHAQPSHHHSADPRHARQIVDRRSSDT